MIPEPSSEYGTAKERPGQKALPVIIDPFSRLGDEVAGDTADEIALNVLRVVELSLRLRATIVRAPLDLCQLFDRYTLSPQARAALDRAETVLRSISR